MSLIEVPVQPESQKKLSAFPGMRGLVALLLCLATLIAAWRVPADQALVLVREYGYFVTLIATLMAAIYGLRLVKGLRFSAASSKVLLFGGISVLVATAVVFYKPSFDYKILMDDYLLAATAKSMHETGDVAVTVFGRSVDGQFIPFETMVDKRPWFYPFLVSWVHDCAGYDGMHPFWLNALLAIGFLFLVYFLGYRLGGVGAGVCAVLLWASLPLLKQNATGGGMEMLNLFMLHLILVLSVAYLQSPSAKTEGVLCLSAVLLTYSRYESGLFLGAVLLIIVSGWWRSQRVILSWGAVVSAPLLLAAALQTKIYAASESSWELGAGVTEPFALQHIWTNLPHAFRFLFHGDAAIANSWLLGCLAVPAIGGFFILLPSRIKQYWSAQPAAWVLTVFSLFFLMNLALVLSFHAGQFDARYVARYSLPLHAFIVLATITCLAPLGKRAWWVLGGLSLCFIVAVTIPKNEQELYSKANFMVAEQHWLESLDTACFEADALIIDRFNITWGIRERSALAPHIAWQYRDRLAGETAAIYLVQRMETGEMGAFQAKLPAVAALADFFEVEPLAAQSFREGELTQVLRLRPRSSELEPF